MAKERSVVTKSIEDCHDVMTIEDCVEVLGISKPTVYRLLQEGRIQCVRIGRRYIVPRKSVAEFIYPE